MDFYNWQISFYDGIIYVIMTAMQIFFAPILFFIMHPERIAMVAGLFFVGSILFSIAQKPARPPMVACIGWALFAMWEQYCKKSGYDIRIDLFVIVPVLYALTAWGLISPFRKPAEDCGAWKI